MAASERPGSGTGFKQRLPSGAGSCRPFGQSMWHCWVRVNMFAHAVMFSPQDHCSGGSTVRGMEKRGFHFQALANI